MTLNPLEARIYHLCKLLLDNTSFPEVTCCTRMQGDNNILGHLHPDQLGKCRMLHPEQFEVFYHLLDHPVNGLFVHFCTSEEN